RSPCPAPRPGRRPARTDGTARDAASAAAAEHLRDVLCDQHRSRSAGHVVSLRARAAALSRLSASRVWTDGYYNPTSSSDNRISDTVATQKHACVVEREKMLKGEPAREQCVIMLNVGFLNNADIDGKAAPPDGAPNVMMAAGGTQLDNILQADHIDTWQFHVD